MAIQFQYRCAVCKKNAGVLFDGTKPLCATCYGKRCSKIIKESKSVQEALPQMLVRDAK